MRVTHLCGEQWEGDHHEVLVLLADHKARCPAEHAAQEALNPTPEPVPRRTILPVPWRRG